MKTRIIASAALSLTFATVLPASAQKLSVGLEAGLNRTTVAGADAAQPGALTRALAGGYIVVKLGNALALQPELLYAQKGATEVDNANGEVTTEVTGRVNYVQVPLLLRVQPSAQGRKIAPHAFAGPAIAFKAACGIAVQAPSVDRVLRCDDPSLQMKLKSTDVSAVFGAGAELAVGRAALVLDGRYDWGLTKIVDASPEADLKNRSFALTGGIRFPLGTRAVRTAAR